MPSKTTMIPLGSYERMTEQLPLRPQHAVLFRSGGSWWLRYEDGWTRNTHHAAYPPEGFRKADMVKIVAGPETGHANSK